MRKQCHTRRRYRQSWQLGHFSSFNQKFDISHTIYKLHTSLCSLMPPHPSNNELKPNWKWAVDCVSVIGSQNDRKHLWGKWFWHVLFFVWPISHPLTWRPVTLYSVWSMIFPWTIRLLTSRCSQNFSFSLNEETLDRTPKVIQLPELVILYLCKTNGRSSSFYWY